MREIHLHDTRSGQVVQLQPPDDGRVGIYACGPTVYSRIHIGNARPFVVFSLLARFLRHEGLETTLVINVTDVNDKIYAARGDGSSKALASEMTLNYIRDTNALGLGRPDHEPLASKSMGAIVSYIEDLIDGDWAYESDGDVFFRVRSDPRYGMLSHRRIDEMDQGEGVEGSERKEDPLDFALWKASKPGEDASWPSPWGDGRPGWHIECSAMAEQALGIGFDIHGGGSDLLFPHHENEAAQTRCARGQELARIWMHNGMIQLTGEKMAKSAGNIALLHEVLTIPEEGGPHAAHTVIMYLIGGHYRQPLAFSEEEILDAERRIYRIRDALRRVRAGEPSPSDMTVHREAFFDALADDFNTPRALSHLFEWVREANRREDSIGDADLREMLTTIGMGDMRPLEAVGDIRGFDQEADRLYREREDARRRRDFELADRRRKELFDRGYEVRDRPGEPAELIPRWDHAAKKSSEVPGGASEQSASR